MAPAARVPPYRPQLALLVDEAPADDDWLHEMKYDGYRIGCAVERGGVTLWSRRGKDWTAWFPEVAAAARRLPVRSALLDGEVAVVLPDGRTSFQALQRAFGGAGRTLDRARREAAAVLGAQPWPAGARARPAPRRTFPP